MGSKREKRPGVWELRVYLGQIDGKKRWASRTFRGGARDAAKALASFEVECQTAPRATHGTMTVNELLDAYVATRRGDWSPNTRRDQPATADRWIRPVLGTRDIALVRPRDIEALVHDIAADHPSTARKVLAILRSAFEDAVRWDLIATNPARAARRPRTPPPRTATVPLGRLRDLIAAADPAMATIVRLAVITGARRGELLGLRWGDVDLDAGAVTVRRAVVGAQGKLTVKGTKTGRVKVLALDPATVSAMKSWRVRCATAALEMGAQLGDDRYLFAQRPDGRDPWWPETLTHKWRRLADEHGLTGVRFHDLRHTTATTLVAAGVDPKTAASRLGHDPSVMLGVYAHALPALDQDAAAIMAKALDG